MQTVPAPGPEVAPIAVMPDLNIWSMPLPPPASSLPPATANRLDQGSLDVAMTNMLSSPDMVDTTPISVYLTGLVCSDLDLSYFNRVHPLAPMLHQKRYRIWSKQATKSKQRVCLQYAMWTIAASLTSQFQFLRDRLYTETRQLLNDLDVGDEEVGPTTGLLERCQSWILVALYEFTRIDYQRGLVSAGRAFRIAQLLGLSAVDADHAAPAGAGCVRDWVDAESRRRTFWLAYSMDRFTGVHNGPILTFNEQEISTRLPAPDENFTCSRPAVMPFLSEVMSRTGSDHTDRGPGGTSAAHSSSFFESILVATLAGRILSHRQRSAVEQSQTSGQVTQDFCRRHQWLDRILRSRIETLSLRTGLGRGDGDNLGGGGGGGDDGDDSSGGTGAGAGGGGPHELPEADPTLILAAMTANMNALLLCETIESARALGGEESHSLLVECNRRSLEATREMAALAAALGQFNHFQTHFFTPIPLLAAARFCGAHTHEVAAGQDYGVQSQTIDRALAELANANQMAKDYLPVPVPVVATNGGDLVVTIGTGMAGVPQLEA